VKRSAERPGLISPSVGRLPPLCLPWTHAVCLGRAPQLSTPLMRTHPPLCATLHTNVLHSDHDDNFEMWRLRTNREQLACAAVSLARRCQLRSRRLLKCSSKCIRTSEREKMGGCAVVCSAARVQLNSLMRLQTQQDEIINGAGTAQRQPPLQKPAAAELNRHGRPTVYCATAMITRHLKQVRG